MESKITHTFVCGFCHKKQKTKKKMQKYCSLVCRMYANNQRFYEKKKQEMIKGGSK